MQALRTHVLESILLLALLLGTWTPATAAVSKTFFLPDETEFAVSLKPFITAYADRDGRLDFEQIRLLAARNPDIFQPAEIRSRTATDPESAWWLQLVIANTRDHANRLTLVAGPSNLEHVDFFVEANGEQWHTRAGTQVPILQQQDLTRFPTLRLHLNRDESVRVWIKIKSYTPYTLNPVLYTRRLFQTADSVTTSSDSILVGAGGALVACMILAAIVTRRAPLLWLAAIGAGAVVREAAGRDYLQRLLWPLDATWGYRLELTLDILYLALCAMFVRRAANSDPLAIPGTRVYPAAIACLCTCLLAAMLLPVPFALPVPISLWLYQGLTAVLAACMLASAAMLARRAPAAPTAPAARRARTVAALLGLSAIFIIVDAGVRTMDPFLPSPLIPNAMLLDSGSPPLALLAVIGNLTVLTLWAATQFALSRPAWPAASPARSRRVPPPVPPVPSAALPPQDPENAPTPPASLPAAAPAVAAQASVATHQAMILGYVGHDLRAPLAIISGYVRLLRQAAAPTQHEYLDVIERSVGHQFGLIEELLTYSMLELEPFAVHPEEVELPLLLDELARFGIALCTDQRNSFEYLPAPTLPAVVRVDGKRLRQTVLNLLGNAAKFTTDGTVRFEARVQEQDAAQAELHIAVFNDGPHISVEDQREIFLAFRQLHRRESGLGLGLFIVERIARAMGGNVRVESAPERGSRFHLTILVELVDASAVGTRPLGQAHADDLQGPPLAAPPLALRLALSRLAQDGELSEIENWIYETRAVYPQYQAFYDEVAKRVETFDMERLQRLALQGTM
ncbi:ATP-binding protein [Bordetella genomosp. 8]|nr:ATP-binding protein [Bordetella genomosp. 8]